MTAPDPLAWLDALADTHSKATGGEWWVADDGVTVEIRGDDGESVRDKFGFYEADAAAIVAAHNAMPELLRLARERCALEAAALALAEEWRYKGEHGWGAWQEGHGPDIEGQVLDGAATRLRSTVTAALAGPHTTDEEADRG